MSRTRSISARTLTGLVLALAVGAPVRAAAPPDPRDPNLRPGERLGALVQRMRVENERLHTLEANFTQRKESVLLAMPEVAEGVFSYRAPDQVRWEYIAPDPISLLINGNEMITWYRDLGRAERMNVGRRSQQVLKYLGAGTSMETLLEYFNVYLRTAADQREPFKLMLDPRYARLAKRLSEMELWIDGDTFLPVYLRYSEPDGDTTEYRFRNFRINRELPQDRFELDLPQNVTLREVGVAGRAGAR